MDVQNSKQICDLRTAFPRVPEDALAGLSHHDPVTSLTTSTDADIVYESLADWMIGHSSVCIGTILPGLWLARDGTIQATPLPTRIVSALARMSITVWGEVVEWSPSFLLDVHGFGEGSLRTFLTVAAQVSAEACSLQRPPTASPLTDSFEARCRPPMPDFKIIQLRRVADWAINEARAMTVGEFLAAWSRADLPEDIALLRDSLHAVPLILAFPGVAQVSRLESLVRDLYGVLNKRTQLIFFGRISLNSLRTREDLSNELGVTRERVRQLALRAEERVREAVTTPRFVPILWRAHALRIALGIAVPSDMPHFHEVTGQILEDVSKSGRERVLDVLLWLAGPYSWSSASGWLCAAEMPESEILTSFCDDRDRVDLERLRAHLSASGLLPVVQPAWLEQVGKIKYVEGNWLVWTGNVTDKAIRILEIWGRPATPEELVVAIDEGRDVKSSRNRFFEDERFMRVEINRVGLRAWGMEEYSSIAEEMDQELERRGGSADIKDLIETLVARFNLRENSVRFFANAPPPPQESLPGPRRGRAGRRPGKFPACEQ